MANSDVLVRMKADTQNYDANIAKARKQLDAFKKAPGDSTSQVVQTEKKDAPQDKPSAVEDFFATRKRAAELYSR